MLQAISGVIFVLMLSACGDVGDAGKLARTPINRETGLRQNLNNFSNAFYTVSLWIDGKEYDDVIVDTGSSNLFLLGNQTIWQPELCHAYNCESDLMPPADCSPYGNPAGLMATNCGLTYTPNENQSPAYPSIFAIRYGKGCGAAFSYRDEISFDEFGQTVSYDLGVFACGSDIQNILGLGFPAAVGGPKEAPDQSLLPFLDKFAAETGLENLFTLNICPANSANSFMTIGVIDSQVSESKLHYTEVVPEPTDPTPTFVYYSVEPTSLIIGTDEIPFPTELPKSETDNNFGYRTIVDSGTSLLYLQEEMVNHIARHYEPLNLPVGFWNLNETEPITVDPAMQANLKDLQIKFPDKNNPGKTFTVSIPPSAYAPIVTFYDQDKNPVQRMISGLRITDKPIIKRTSHSVEILPASIILGDVFMQVVYVVFDPGKHRLGMMPNQELCPQTPEA